MHMGMVLKVLAPGVQDGGEADVGTEVLGIGRDGGERRGCGCEQQSVELGLVLVGDGAERGWQREHDNLPRPTIGTSGNGGCDWITRMSTPCSSRWVAKTVSQGVDRD